MLTLVKALEFLSSHRDTIVIMLKNDSEEVVLSYIEEIHLLVSLSGSLLFLVPKSELASPRVESETTTDARSSRR
jgi:nuclear pore complex protein Nup205